MAAAIHIDDDDVIYEQDIVQNTYSVKAWLRYLHYKQEAPLETRSRIFERALVALPGSYKLWRMYLRERTAEAKKVPITDAAWGTAAAAFERALVFQHKAPRIWLDYLAFMTQWRRVTRTRQTFDRALRALPITQHLRVWPLYIKWVTEIGVPETAIRVFRRYLMLAPERAEDYVNYLLDVEQYDEAAVQLSRLVDRKGFVSQASKSNHELWLELCMLVSKHAADIVSLPVEPILRNGIARFTDEVGQLWVALGDYFIRRGQFEAARDVFEEAMAAVGTVRDFSLVFDAYSQFEETMIAAKLEAQAEAAAGNVSAADADDEVDLDLQMRFGRFERLIARRDLLINTVLLKQNPHNVYEWLKRTEVHSARGDGAKAVAALEEGLRTVDAQAATGSIHELWVALAKTHEREGDLAKARAALESGVASPNHKSVQGLAALWAEAAELELRHNAPAAALALIRRATRQQGTKPVDFYDESIPPAQRVFKVARLWSLHIDLEEALGDLASTRAVYDRVLALRIATPQMVLNYAAMLEEAAYFEDSFAVFEKGVAVFTWPHVGPLWSTYLAKFSERYGGTRVERTRMLFESALVHAPAGESKPLYIMWANFERDHGSAKRALGVLATAAKAVAPADRLFVYKLLIKRTAEEFGVTHCRPIYTEAIEALPDQEARQMCLAFAALEISLGEVDRARAVYAHCSQFCPPSRDADFWEQWQAFEKAHGNADTFRDVLRVKRSVQAQYATSLSFTLDDVTAAATAAAAGADPMAAMEAAGANANLAAAGAVSFILGETTVVGGTKAAAAKAAANAEEIDLDAGSDGDDDGDDGGGAAPMQAAVPSAVFGGIGGR